MAVPRTREQFKDYCLRRLGYPVIDINVDDEQVEDRIDDALAFFQDFHGDATERTYLKHVLTQDEINQGYIVLPDEVYSVTTIFNVSTYLTSSSMFNVKYQMFLNDWEMLSSESLVPYFITMRRVEEMENLLQGMPQIRFNRYVSKLRLDIDKNTLTAGQYVIIDCYLTLDPEEFTKIWTDRFLQQYATELIKRQWGANLSKFDGMEMPGGLKFNGQKIYEEADERIRYLEQEIHSTYSIPPLDMIG